MHVVEAVRADGDRVEVHRWAGSTAWGDVLEATVTNPVDDAVAVRVTTTASPSWVAWAEIEVLAS